MTPEQINRQEAIAAFAERHRTLSPSEVESVFDQWMECGALDFMRDENGRWRVVLCGPRRRQ